MVKCWSCKREGLSLTPRTNVKSLKGWVGGVNLCNPRVREAEKNGPLASMGYQHSLLCKF